MMSMSGKTGYVPLIDYENSGLHTAQDEHNELAITATNYQDLATVVPNGILQIPEYTAELHYAAHPNWAMIDMDEFLARRHQRSFVLDHLTPEKQFTFLMTEQCVRWRIAPDAIMNRQINHIADLVTKPQVEIAILPLQTRVPVGAMESFVILDGTLVVAEIATGEVRITNPHDIAVYQTKFDALLAEALTGASAEKFLRSVAAEFG